MALISGFQSFNTLESTGPAVIEGERLGEGLTDDVACLVGKEKLWVKRNDFDCEGGALGRELGIKGFQMKEDGLFCLEHLGCALAGNRDENEMFWFHILYCFSSDTIYFCVRLFAKRFHLLKYCRIFGICAKQQRKTHLSEDKCIKRKRNAVVNQCIPKKIKLFVFFMLCRKICRYSSIKYLNRH